MRRLVLFFFAAATLAACGRNDSAMLDVTVYGAGGKEIILSKLQMDRVEVVDTVTADASGHFKYDLTVNESAPDFFYVSYNRKRLASLIAKGGDKIKLTVDTLGGGFSVNGSEESVLLYEIEQEVFSNTKKFDSLSVELVNSVEAGDEEKGGKIQRELSDLYVQYKRSAIRRLMTNPASFANISLLYQRLGDNLYLFSDPMDIVYFQKVRDTLVKSYPDSPYVKSLDNEIENFNNVLLLNDRISEASEIPFPDLVLPDKNAEACKMSDLNGRPFLLIFWTATNVQQKIFNQDMKDLYEKYSGKGLGIYQVSVDVDKALWASVVKEQQLPWINVCDGLGVNSPALSTYNVQQLPAMFIFNSDGEIVAKNIFEKEKLDAELSKLR